MKLGETVIVVDTANYKASYSEDVPFKAKIIDQYDNMVVVKSGRFKEYELYEHQVLEGLSIKEIRNMLDLTKYGKL